MRVLGVDPSLTSTGVACVDDGRLVFTTRIASTPPARAKGDKTPATLRERHDRIGGIVDELAVFLHPGTLGPRLAVIEAPSYGSVGGSAWDRAWLWGRIVSMLFARDIPVAMVPPATRALWATGSGRSGKGQVAVPMSRMWPDVGDDVSDDIWDALALATMGAQHLGLLPVDLARHREQLAKIAWPDIPAGVPA